MGGMIFLIQVGNQKEFYVHLENSVVSRTSPSQVFLRKHKAMIL